MILNRNRHELLGMLVLIFLLSGLTACSPQAAITESPEVEAPQARSIKVYESPT